MSFIRRFYNYQKERFPIVLLAISLIPAVMSSGAIVIVQPMVLQIALAVVAGLLYLFHIRVIDEHRDFAHDTAHHASRPVQAGVISKADLQALDIAAIIGILAIAIFSGYSSVILALLMLAYSFVAGKEFFVGEKIRKRFFLYNSVNVVQMLLMQLFIYSLFGMFTFSSPLLLWHFIFTSLGTLLFEFIRKIHVPGDDGTGKDTYSWYLGFKNSVAVATIMLGLDILLFIKLAGLISGANSAILTFAILSIVFAGASAFIHVSKKQKLTGQGMQLVFLLVYAGLNLAIYFLRT